MKRKVTDCEIKDINEYIQSLRFEKDRISNNPKAILHKKVQVKYIA